jgi:PIN domain nuclease of toxin-antitoxin system
MIIEPGNEVFLSPASVWEIVIKHWLGRLFLKQPPGQYIVGQRRLHRIDSLESMSRQYFILANCRVFIEIPLTVSLLRRPSSMNV